MTPTPNQDGRVPVIFRATGPKADPVVVALFPNEPGPDGAHQMLAAHIGSTGDLAWTSQRWADYVRRSWPAGGYAAEELAYALGAGGLNLRLDIRQRLSDENHAVRAHRAASRTPKANAVD